jgi:hypothetical protein
MKAIKADQPITWSESVFFEAGGTDPQQLCATNGKQNGWRHGKKTTAGGYVMTIHVMPAYLGRAVAELDAKNKVKILFYHWSGGQA